MPGYNHIPCYTDLYQTTLNYFHIILGTCAPNPAACFWYSHSTCTRSRAGSRGGGEQTHLKGHLPSLSSSPGCGLSPRTAAGTFPGRLCAGEPRAGGPGAPARLFSSARVCGCQLRVHKTGLHQTDQPPSSPHHYPRHKSWQKAAAKASADSPNNSGHKGPFCLRRWHKSDAITPARLQLAPYLFI